MYAIVNLLPTGNRLTKAGRSIHGMTYEDIVVSVENGVATVAINRPDSANKLRFQTARELLDALRHVRETRELDAVVLTGTGEKFFCIGGEHEELSSLDYS